MFDLIPADRRAAVRSALVATFGASPVPVLQPVTGGASALIYRIEVAGRPYLLRLESLQRDEVRDPQRAYLCMRRAVDAGIAPAVHHADPVAGIAILDFLAARPLSDYPTGPDGLARDLGTLAARLQATQTFPSVAIDYPAMLASLFDRVQASGLFVAGLLDRHREGFERIREAYPWDDRSLVSSHNDLHPENILFDGERLWLIDWETAHANDPLLDVAVLTMFLAASPNLEEALLCAWLGRAPDEALRARLILMRQLARIFYACASALHAATAEPEARLNDLTALTPLGFRAAVAAGRLALGTPQAQRVGCKVSFRTFLEGLAKPAFEEALLTLRSSSGPGTSAGPGRTT